jgi:hypothetical protein
MIEYWKMIDWKSVNWSLMISILALISTIIFNIFSHRNSQKTLNVELQRYKDEQEEKAKRQLEIKIWNSSKNWVSSNMPLKWFGLWLIVTNRGIDQPLLARTDVILHFKENRPSTQFSLISIFEYLLNKPSEVTVSFPLYNGGVPFELGQVGKKAIQEDFHFSTQFPLGFYLLDWDNKKPIYYSPQNEYRMPLPGNKQRWYLFGNIPDEDGEKLMSSDFELEKVGLIFITDQGRIELEEQMTRALGDELVAEYSKYTFDY